MINLTTPEGQYEMLTRFELKDGLARPFEMKLREIAAQLVERGGVYNGNGVTILFAHHAGDLRIKLSEYLRPDPEHAQLIVEQIIRDHIPEWLV
jgi:hypothetical protein